jgi:hypothetical protein
MRRDFASLPILKMFQGMAALQITIYPTQAILNIRGFPIPASGIPLGQVGESLPTMGEIPTRPVRLAGLKYKRNVEGQMAEKSKEVEDIIAQSINVVQSGRGNIDSCLAESPEYAEVLRPLLELVLWLDQQKGSFDPRPDFVSASRKRLVVRIKDVSASTRKMHWPNK